MSCEDTRELIGAYLDGELDVETKARVACHIRHCAECGRTAAQFRKLGQQLAALAPKRLPKGLAERLFTAIARDATEARFTRPARMGWLKRAAAIALVVGLSGAAGGFLATHVTSEASLEREIFSAHIRGLLQDNPIQVASSDGHTVRPWFAGKLDVAPDVKDLEAQGFKLLGGRLDLIDAKRVGTLVYKRNQHIVNVFVLSGRDHEAEAHTLVHQGYNAICWSRAGITYWAVSDLNLQELKVLQGLL